MFNKLTDWLNDRTGYRALVHEALEEPIPGGPRWRYVFGSALSTTFAIQLVTGVLLMCSYSPSSSTAWGSVFYISQSQWMGWFVRGIHHFGSQAMVVLLPLHLLQVLTARAYRAPREVNWWFGMALLFLTLGFSLTGYLLPWDQKGYWATKVATNIMGGAPGLGPYVQKILVGGSDYGNQTVTRFYGLHVGILPLLFIMCLVAHVALFRRHGPTPPRDAHQRVTGTFWPEQLFRDAVASVVVVGIMLSLVLSEHGANLDAPADPSSPDYPARPEWYFLSLFQLLKLFPGDREVIGTIIIPSAILVVMLLIPLFDRIMPSKLAHVLACCFVFALVGGAGYLTYAAWKSDAHDIVFQEQRKKADQARQRALEVAAQGIPPEGSAYVLLHDPLYHGRGMLEKKCLICHYYGGQGQVTVDASGKATSSPQRASDLKDFGARAWLRGLLENPKSDHYFGKVPQCRGMNRWRKKTKLTPKELDDIADFFAQYVITTPPDITPAEWEHQEGLQNHPGYVAFHKEGECVMCHAEWGAPNDEAPNLFGWGSPRWIAKMIHRPGASVLYGFLKPKDQMPAFTSDQLTENDVTMIIHFLKNDIGPRPAPAEAPQAEVAEAARRERP